MDKLKKISKYNKIMKVLKGVKKRQIGNVQVNTHHKGKLEKNISLQPIPKQTTSALWIDQQTNQAQKQLQNLHQKLSYHPFFDWTKDTTDIHNIQQLTDIKNKNRIDIQCIAMSNVFHNSVVRAVQKIGQNTILSAGYDGLIKVWELDQLKLRASLSDIRNIYLQKFPIQHLKKINQSEVVLSGNRKYLQVFNLEKEKSQKLISSLLTQNLQQARKSLAANSSYITVTNKNTIIVLDSKTKQVVRKLCCPQKCLSVALTKDLVYSTTNSGKIMIFNLGQGNIMQRIQDQGSIGSNSIDCSQRFKMFMTGTSTGTANLYNDFSKGHLKQFDNLTTSVEKIAFNPTYEQVAFSSPWKTNSVRIVNLQSLKIYQNWPNINTRLKYVSSLSYSQDGKQLLIGNDAGRIFIYNLNNQ